MKVNASTKISSNDQVLTEPMSVRNLENTSATYRLAYSAATTVLIGSVFIITTAPLGAFLVLPLMGVYTGMCVVFGRSPLSAVIEANMPAPYIVPPDTEDAAVQNRNAKRPEISRAA